MIRYDCHMHTSFSSDSETPPKLQIEKAIELGMKGICVTDHMDYDFPDAVRSGMDFEFDPEDYFRQLGKLKDEYGSKIELLIGVEVGLRNEPECKASIKEKYERLLNGYPFDLVIGSTHCLEFTDPYYESPYWDNKDKACGIRTYFEAIKENVVYYPDFDSLGHLDYLIRYVPKSTNDCKSTEKKADYNVSDFIDIIDEILRLLIDTGKALEVNTAGLKYGLGYPHPKAEVLKRYCELGGELLTIGSDGHKPEHICYDFGKASELLKELGYSYYTIYRGRRPYFIKL
ncbi:MAG: histidinol-phosphatase HisJ family protein [Lachnospiraceae bacterium]|nr:histidinol-phosphatase HisJ family protein [Lachnospiraceae bacterium]